MIKKNLSTIRQRIHYACQSAQREPKTVILVAVSKRHQATKIRQAYEEGQREFGENYLNEALEKQNELNDLAISWHFIGHIQSNKTRKISENFAWVHTVDSLKIAQRLSQQRPQELPPLNICLQVNIDNEDSKSGITANGDTIWELAQSIMQLPHVQLRGLMCIPAPKLSKEEEIKTFTAMKKLQHDLNERGCKLDTLSMGMSDDLENAIACGATIVRIGTAIFGKRT